MPRLILKNLGLSQDEIRIYLTCLTAEHLGISALAKKSGIKRTTLYPKIDNMIKRGFITTFENNGNKVYAAIDPEALLEKLKIKQAELGDNINRLDKLIPALSNLKGKYDKIAKLEFFEGTEALKSLMEKEFSKDEGDVYQFASGGSHDTKEVGKLFLSLIDKNEINLKTIDKKTSKSNIIESTKAYRGKHPARAIKYIEDEKYQPKISTITKGDSVIFLSSHDRKPIGIVVKNQDITDNIKNLFEYLWDKGDSV